ncbi:MAG: hypothetical protein RIR48_2680, partial [Bacteroidota bacterium]
IYSTWSILQHYHNEEIIGKLSKDEAQQKVIQEIKQIRYGRLMDNYFWITDKKPTMIMHPYRSDLTGKSLGDYKDYQGKKIFIESVNIINEKSEGYLEYVWQSKTDSTSIVSKHSFVKEFKPWGWILGTDIYVEDDLAEIKSLIEKLVGIYLIIVFWVTWLLWYIFYQSLKLSAKRKRDEIEIYTAKYKSMVEASTDGLIMLINGKISFVNHVILKMTGFNAEELIGSTFKPLISNQNNPDVQKMFSKKTLPEGQFEVKFNGKNKGQVDVFITSSVLFQRNETINILIVKDITIDKLSHLSLIEYSTLLSHLSLGFFKVHLGKNAYFEYANNSVVRLLGYQQFQELLDYSLYDFIPDQKDKDDVKFQLFKNGFVANKKLQIKKSDNASIVVLMTLIVVEKKENNELLCDGMIEDISETEKEKKEWLELINAQHFSMFLMEQKVKSFIENLHSTDIECTIDEAIEKMEKYNTDCLLIVKDKSNFLGIVTKTDIQKRIFSLKLKIEDPIYLVMSSPVVSISENSSINDAFLIGEAHQINHLPVTSVSGEWKGILNLNYVLHQLKNSLTYHLSWVKNSNSNQDISKARHSLIKFITPLIKSEILPHFITEMMTTFSDAVIRKIIENGLVEFGKPPVNFVFICLGSEGRKEETLLTDQDNAIIFEDLPDEQLSNAKEYFDQLARYICDTLNEVGYDYCKGDIMAKNPYWTQPYSNWVQYFTQWITIPEPINIMEASIFFDLRGVYGDLEMVNSLRAQLEPIITQNETFFYHLAYHTYNVDLPSVPSRHLQPGKLEPIDIKSVLSILTMFARTYSLKHHIPQTHTLERIESINDKQIISYETFSEFTFAYNYFFKLRFRTQIEAIQNNLSPHNKLHLSKMTETEISLIKRLLHVIVMMQNKIATDFRIKI